MNLSERKKEILISISLILIGFLLLSFNIFSIIGLYTFYQQSEVNSLDTINLKQNLIRIIPSTANAFFVILSGFFLYLQKRIGWIMGNISFFVLLLFPFIIFFKNVFEKKNFKLFDNSMQKSLMYLCFFLFLYSIYFLNSKSLRSKYNIELKHYLSVFIFASITILFLLFI
jgi:hypothetical protein